MRILINPDAIEALASLEHIRWSDWMIYLFDHGKQNEDGTFTIPAWAVERWRRQANTPYQELSVEEKESDLKEVKRYLTRMQDLDWGIIIGEDK